MGAVSQTVAEVLRSGVSFDESRMRVIPNGVDASVFRPHADDGSVRAELGLSATVPILGSIGRLEPVKGYAVMIDALAELQRDWTDGERPVLVIAGAGSDRAALEARA